MVNIASVLAAASMFAQEPAGVWERLADYPIEAFEVSAVALNGKVYAMCGLTPGGATNRMFVYDPLVDQWTEGPAVLLPNGGDHCNVAAVNGKLYLLGALVRAQGPASADGGTFEFDPATGVWTRVAEMPGPRAASGVAVIGSRIYVVGGISGSANYASLDVFDTISREWSRLPDMPTRRDHLTAQAVNGRIYAIGGHPGRGQNSPANEEFDPVDQTWRTRAPFPVPGGGMASGVMNGRIVVAGSGDGFTATVEYDPEKNEWRALAPMESPRNGWYGSGAVMDGRLFLPAGGPTPGTSYSRTTTAFVYPAGVAKIAGVRSISGRNAPIRAGDTVIIWGERLSQGARIGDGDAMNVTSVLLNGERMALSYVSDRMVVAAIPAGAVSTHAQLRVMNAAGLSEPLDVEVQL